MLIKAGCDIHSGEVRRPLRLAARGSHLQCVRALTRAGAALVAGGEVVEDGELDEDAPRRNMAPELRLLRAMRRRNYDDSDSSGRDVRNAERRAERRAENAAKVHKFLRMVRLAGGWRSYVTEERRALATLMELWKRQRRAADPPRYPTRSAARELRRGDGGAPSFESAPGDVVAAWVRVFELPPDLAGLVLRFYTDLVL